MKRATMPTPFAGPVTRKRPSARVAIAAAKSSLAWRLWVAIPPVPKAGSRAPAEVKRARPVSELGEVVVGRTDPASRICPPGRTARSLATACLPANVARAMPLLPNVRSRPAVVALASVKTSRLLLVAWAIT